MMCELSNKKVLVIGYAVTGKSVVEFLIAQGARVTLTDRGNLSEDSSVSLLKQAGVHVVDGGHPISLLDEHFDFIVKNPGIPYQIPFIQAALERKIPIYTDVELAYWVSQAPIVGVTGSNGKTTTTSWIRQLLAERPQGQAYLAGNIGVPSLETAVKATAEDIIVMELSSFQLVGTERLRPHIAVLTNITSTHLDYHGTQAEYELAKMNLVARQLPSDYCVYNYEDVTLRPYMEQVVAQKVPFAVELVDDFVKEYGAYVENGVLYFRKERVATVSDIGIPGRHNVENALAALAVAKLCGVDNQAIQAGLSHYVGMPHRLQAIAKSHGRIFYNDSKSTNRVATITALKSFEQPIRYIGGGLDRGNEFDELVPYLGQVQSAYLYGQSKDKMARAFREAEVADIQLVTTLQEATTLAYQAAQAGEVILFSPSCASWDQYKNFEERGEDFVACVEHLLATQPYAD